MFYLLFAYYLLYRPLETLSPPEVLLEEKRLFMQCVERMHIDITALEGQAKAIDRCVRPERGISGQYLYRSMYAALIKRCSRYIPLENMLFINTEEMKQNLTEAIEKVVFMYSKKCCFGY